MMCFLAVPTQSMNSTNYPTAQIDPGLVKQYKSSPVGHEYEVAAYGCKSKLYPNASMIKREH